VPRDLSIADRCRSEGLRVVECDGWQSRGSSDFNPRGSVDHHTADGPNGSAPSLDGIINGFSGSAPGPLAQVMQSREPDGNDIFYVVAAGRANHAGEGGWHGLSGNSSVIGLEIEHTGTDPLPEHRQRLAARFHAAMARGRWDASMVCQHKEWAPGRKIDAAENVDVNQFRQWVGDDLAGQGDDDMPLNDADKAWIQSVLLDTLRKDGVSGAADGNASGVPEKVNDGTLHILRSEGISDGVASANQKLDTLLGDTKRE
jgi:hypothetical protein